MFKINEYFNGKVKSIAFKTAELPATLGVMAAGEYEFGTTTKEIMKIITGKVSVKLPNQNTWQNYSANDSFSVEANKKFLIKVAEETSYLCLYTYHE